MRRDVPFSVVTKPTGAACNLDCTYCFFLSKELLYDADGQRMSEATLRTYIANQLDSQPDGDVMLVWQGGEPTMRGLAFYKEAVRLGNALKRPRQNVQHSMQTNGTLLDDDWCEFLAAENFLVGLSVDGPEELHDAYRVNKAGRGTHKRVMRGWELLRKHSVETNVLCTVNAANADHGTEVYRWFRDKMGTTFLQFIPIVERVPHADLATAEKGWIGPDGARLLYRQAGDAVTSRSVTGHQWGDFLCEVFDEWRAHDVGTMYVQHFDTMLAARFGQYSLCVHAPESQRRHLLLRPLRGAWVQTGEHPRRQARRCSGQRSAEGVRSIQADRSHDAVPAVSRSLGLPRRLPQRSLRRLRRWRGRPEFPVRWLFQVFFPRHRYGGGHGTPPPSWARPRRSDVPQRLRVPRHQRLSTAVDSPPYPRVLKYVKEF